MRLLAKLQDDLGLSYMFITHDLATVRAIADEVVVMKDGRVVDAGQRPRCSSRHIILTLTFCCLRSLKWIRIGSQIYLKNAELITSAMLQCVRCNYESPAMVEKPRAENAFKTN